MWWQRLGVESDAQEADIRRAYAKLIRQYRPDTHPLEFSEVRLAYEQAQEWLRHRQYVQQWEAAEPPSPEADAGQHAGQTEPDDVLAEPAEMPLPNWRPLRTAPLVDSPGELQQIREMALQAAAVSESQAQSLFAQHLGLLQQWSIDARMDYQVELLQVLLHTEQLPLSLVYAASLEFAWPDSVMQDLQRQFPESLVTRFLNQVHLANRRQFATWQRRNPWLNRLFAANGHENLRRITWQYKAAHALAFIEEWRYLCDKLRLPSATGGLNGQVVSALQRGTVWSSDIWSAVLAAGFVFASVGGAASADTALGVLTKVLGGALVVFGLAWFNRVLDQLPSESRWRWVFRPDFAGFLVGLAAMVIPSFLIIVGVENKLGPGHWARWFAAVPIVLVQATWLTVVARYVVKLVVKLEDGMVRSRWVPPLRKDWQSFLRLKQSGPMSPIGHGAELSQDWMPEPVYNNHQFGKNASGLNPSRSQPPAKTSRGWPWWSLVLFVAVLNMMRTCNHDVSPRVPSSQWQPPPATQTPAPTPYRRYSPTPVQIEALLKAKPATSGEAISVLLQLFTVEATSRSCAKLVTLLLQFPVIKGGAVDGWLDQCYTRFPGSVPQSLVSRVPTAQGRVSPAS